MNDDPIAAETPGLNAPATRVRGRPFARGNPGRPVGSRNNATVILDQLADGAATDVLTAVVTAARAGDLKAAEILLSRIWPVKRGRPVRLALPSVETPADVSSAIGVVAEAVASGSVTPEEGQAVAAVLELKRRAIETAELAERVAALEQRAVR